MLGRHHLLISIASVTAVTVPFLDDFTSLFLVVFAGTTVGSLIPDIDSPDSTIFHSRVDGLDGDIGALFNSFFAPVFPLFGYATRYLIYRPGVFAFNQVFDSYSFEDHHRNFSHSILGVATMTAMTGLYLAYILAAAGLFHPVFLAAFLAAYMTGAFLHLLEDSCTRSGIAWNSPFSDTKLEGELVTSSKPDHMKKPRYLVYTLGLISFVIFLLSNTGFYNISDFQVAAIGLTALAVAWLFFIEFAAGIEISS